MAAVWDCWTVLIAPLVFSLGYRPSGSKDPFALRRLGQSIVRIFLELSDRKWQRIQQKTRHNTEERGKHLVCYSERRGIQRRKNSRHILCSIQRAGIQGISCSNKQKSLKDFDAFLTERSLFLFEKQKKH